MFREKQAGTDTMKKKGDVSSPLAYDGMLQIKKPQKRNCGMANLMDVIQ